MTPREKAIEAAKEAIWKRVGDLVCGGCCLVHRGYSCKCLEAAEAAIAAYEAAAKEAGWEMKPGEPDKTMAHAGYEANLVSEWPDDWSDDGSTPELYSAIRSWRAMHKAAPKFE